MDHDFLSYDQFLNFLQDSSKTNQRSSIIGYYDSSKVMRVIDFTQNSRVVPVYTIRGGTKALVKKNQKITLPSGNSAMLAPGAYIADLYSIRNRVTLPANAIGITNNSPKCGYNSQTAVINESQRGATFAQAGTTFEMVTYVWCIQYNIVGQYLGGYYAPDLPGSVEFSYSYGILQWQ